MNSDLTNNSITLTRWQPTNGATRYYINGISRPKMYVKLASDGQRVVWSSAHKDRPSRTSSDYAAIRKDEIAWAQMAKPAILALVGKAEWSEVTIEDIERVAR